jgi:hypothetical protein
MFGLFWKKENPMKCVICKQAETKLGTTTVILSLFFRNDLAIIEHFREYLQEYGRMAISILTYEPIAKVPILSFPRRFWAGIQFVTD